MDPAVRERFDALVDEGGVEEIDGQPFVVLHALGSGARCGLTRSPSGDVTWGIEREGQLTIFGPEAAPSFTEVLEGPRDEFDEAVERGAGERGLPAQEVLFSFPAVDLVAAIIATRSKYLSRMALLWLLPSELRALRSEIKAFADDTSMPIALRDLARRLVVPL